MPEINPTQALCALMLGTGEKKLILDAEVVKAVEGVNVHVKWHPDRQKWEIDFTGMPDKDQLEAKGVKTPEVSDGYILGATLLEHPRRDIRPRPIRQGPVEFREEIALPEARPGDYRAEFGVPFDPGPSRDRDHDPVPEEEIPKGKDWIGGV